MINDYSKYELSKKETIRYCIAGYISLFIIVFLFYRSVLFSAVSGFGVWFLLPIVEKHLADQRRLKLIHQFKDLLYSLSSLIASGRGMEEALIEAKDNLSMLYGSDEPLMIELLHMKNAIINNQENSKTLLEDLAKRSHNEDVNNFVQVYVICRQMGGDVEKVICHSCEVLTDKMNIQREILALTAQRRFEGRLISLMPLAMILFLNVFSPSYISVLYTTLAGRVVMTLALGGIVYGTYLMEKLSAIEV